MSDEGEYDFEQDFEQGSPETSPGRGGRRAVAYWATLAEGVPPGPSSAATAARRSLFARLDVDADGFVTLGELERELPGALGAAVPSTKLPPAHRPAPREQRLSAVAKGMADGHHRSSGRVARLRVYPPRVRCAVCVLACGLHRAQLPRSGARHSITANSRPQRVRSAHRQAAGCLRPRDVASASGAPGSGWLGSAGVRGEAVTRWVAQAALRTLCPTQRISGGSAGAGGAGRHPASRRPVPSADEDADAIEDADEDPDAIEDEDGANPAASSGAAPPLLSGCSGVGCRWRGRYRIRISCFGTRRRRLQSPPTGRVSGAWAVAHTKTLAGSSRQAIAVSSFE